MQILLVSGRRIDRAPEGTTVENEQGVRSIDLGRHGARNRLSVGQGPRGDREFFIMGRIIGLQDRYVL